MLYLNAYVEYQEYGGPEEGNWYFTVGTPIASIPIHSDRERGKQFYFSQGDLVVHTCRHCLGKGEVLEADEDYPEQGEYWHHCTECQEIPSDPAALKVQIAALEEMLKHECGRSEEIRVCVEANFAQPYPSERPHYE